MHEYSIVAALVAQVAALAEARHAIAIERIELSLGELSGVDPALLATAYRTFRQNTVCADAELELHSTPAHWQCPSCRREFARGDVLTCERCSVPARLTRGDEIVLERIAMEVP